MSFNYVFASEEYPEYVCSTVNDAFGFFISGPDINGGGQFTNNAENIALIPNTDPPVPVTINTVNPGIVGANGQIEDCIALDTDWMYNNVYYTANDAPSADPDIIEYDGFTVPLNSTIQLVEGETYHMKLAIGDGGDTAYDSAIFIKSNTSVFIWPEIQGYSPQLGDSTVVEGCFNGAFNVYMAAGVDLDFVSLSLSGTAENGVDYEEVSLEIPDDFFGLFEIPIDLIEDFAVEGIENIVLELTYLNEWEETETITSELLIADFEPLQAELPADINFCGEEVITVDATPINGISPFSYTWSDDVSVPEHMFIPEDAGVVSIVITDECGLSLTHEIVLSAADEMLLIDDVTICTGETSPSIIVDGNAPYGFNLNDINLLQVENAFTSTETGEYEINVTDACGYEESITLTVEICSSVEETFESLFNIRLIDGTLIVSNTAFLNCSYRLYDIQGRLLEEINKNSNSSISFELNKYAPSAFVLEVTDEKGKTFRKKIVQ